METGFRPELRKNKEIEHFRDSKKNGIALVARSTLPDWPQGQLRQQRCSLYKMSMGEVVAIVDDDEPVRRALRRLVLSLSYQPTVFASGEEFLASLAGSKPSCVLMDLHMSGLKGLEVLLRMRLNGISLPVIIITAFDQPGMREKCLEAGAAAYLLKPVERSEFSRVIQMAIAD